MISYKDYANRAEWLKGRQNTIGASEVASILGCGFQTPLELWKEKVGLIPHADLSKSERVQYGSEAEQYIRGLFALKFKDEFETTYHAYRIYRNSNYQNLHASLDGELRRLSDGELGILEIKSVFVNKKSDLDEWQNGVKQAYYVQTLTQMQVLERSFAIIYVEFVFPDKTSELKPYLVLRNDGDIEYIKQELDKFMGYVKNNKQPPTTLSL